MQMGDGSHILMAKGKHPNTCRLSRFTELRCGANFWRDTKDDNVGFDFGNVELKAIGLRDNLGNFLSVLGGIF